MRSFPKNQTKRFTVFLKDRQTGRSFTMYIQAKNSGEAQEKAREEKGDTHDVIAAASQ